MSEALHPDVAQIVLTSIYQEIPNIRQSRKRMANASTGAEILTYPEMEQQLGFLRGLLTDAQITDSVKRFIYFEFESSYMFGIPDASDVFRIIGLDYDRGQGIFSTDPNQRIKIEREVYESLINSRKVASEDEIDLVYYDNLINAMGSQFEELYKEPIILGVPTS